MNLGTHIVRLVENPPVDRVRQLTAALVGYGFMTVADSPTALKITVTNDAVMTLTTRREKFDAEMDTYQDVVLEFPELPKT